MIKMKNFILHNYILINGKFLYSEYLHKYEPYSYRYWAYLSQHKKHKYKSPLDTSQSSIHLDRLFEYICLYKTYLQRLKRYMLTYIQSLSLYGRYISQFRIIIPQNRFKLSGFPFLKVVFHHVSLSCLNANKSMFHNKQN